MDLNLTVEEKTESRASMGGDANYSEDTTERYVGLPFLEEAVRFRVQPLCERGADNSSVYCLRVYFP